MGKPVRITISNKTTHYSIVKSAILRNRLRGNYNLFLFTVCYRLTKSTTSKDKYLVLDIKLFTSFLLPFIGKDFVKGSKIIFS